MAAAPLELVRTRLQASRAGEGSSGGVRAGLASVLREAAPGSSLLSRVAPLWRGTGATLARDVPFSALYWTLMTPLLAQLLAAFSTKLPGLKITMLFHECTEKDDSPVRGLFLYESSPWKKEMKTLYAAAQGRPLVEWIRERYAGVDIIGSNNFVRLMVSVEDEEGAEYKMPTFVVRFTS